MLCNIISSNVVIINSCVTRNLIKGTEVSCIHNKVCFVKFQIRNSCFLKNYKNILHLYFLIK